MLINSKSIALAEAGEWETLEMLLDIEPKAAKDMDRFGMLPLHWACTEAKVPVSVISKLLQSYPEGARIKNNSSMLALHIATRTKLSAEHLSLIIKAYPAGVNEWNTDKESPLDLAIRSGLPYPTVKLFLDAQGETGKKKSASPVDNQEKQSSQRLTETHNINEKKEVDEKFGSMLPQLIQELKNLNHSMNDSGKIRELLSNASGSVTSHERRSFLEMTDERAIPISRKTFDVLEYEVSWTSGGLGLRLGPILGSKYGATVVGFQNKKSLDIEQVQVGDELIGINGMDISTLKFDKIARKLKAPRHPTLLRFRSTRQYEGRPVTRSICSSSSSTSEESFYSNPASASSQGSSIPAEVEKWCEEQDQMHSRILLLLTETLQRCEALENQLQLNKNLDPYNLKFDA